MYDRKITEKICRLRSKRQDILKAIATDNNPKDHHKLVLLNRHLYWLTKNPIYL